MQAVDEAHRVLLDAERVRVFPAAVAEAGDSDRVLWTDAVGSLVFDRPAPVRFDTPFDLASLTKVIVTTTVVMQLVESGALTLDTRVEELFPEWRGRDRESVTVRDLLEHASGLPARLVDPPPTGRREFEHDICMIALEYEPRTRSIYSDLGFILLGFAAADRAGAPLAVQFASLWPDDALTFDLPHDMRRDAAPTVPMEDDPRRGRTLSGEVHDSYAAALGGVAGHAGLFGSAAAVGAFARAMLRAARGRDDSPAPLSPDRVAQFLTRSSVPGSSRALGWDLMLTSSSCGARMSPRAFGHVGFTGTSLWIDPVRDRYFVLLTNRAGRGGTVEEMRSIRRAFHDALGDL
jgi:CubicO group peptidase (beta-lactamase class C family)